MRGKPVLGLILGTAFLVAGPARAATTQFNIYTVWMQGQGDNNRAEVDLFMNCLVSSSNFQSYWNGQAVLSYQGSWVIPPPGTVDTAGIGSWVSGLVTAGKLPAIPASVTPVYLVFGNNPPMNMDNTGACGRNSPEPVAGRTAGIAAVRVSPICWNTGNVMRSNTQLAQHEVAEVIDQLLGYWGCSGDGSCEGSSKCGAGACSNFTGLSCPGAPATTVSGCNGVTVKGWLVQKLSHQERQPNMCDICVTCDFAIAPGCAGGGKTINQACSKPTDCCSGLSCQNWSYTGQSPYSTACCHAVGDGCSVGTDCCGGSNCVSGKCACVPAGQWCINKNECCAGYTCDLAAYKCVAAPPPMPDLGTSQDASGAPTDMPGATDGTGATEDAAGNTGSGADLARSEGTSVGGCAVGSATEPGWMGLLLLSVALAVSRRKALLRR